MYLSKNIKEFRVSNNMTQEYLAKLLNTTSKSISRWELGITFPEIPNLIKLSNIFEVSVDDLLGVSEIRIDNYLKDLEKKELEFVKNHELNKILELYQKAYIDYPNNIEIINSLVNIMTKICIDTKDSKYVKNIVELSEKILLESKNDIITTNAKKNLVLVYKLINNIELSKIYCNELSCDLLTNGDILKTRYLNDEELQYAVYNNLNNLIDELILEYEFQKNYNILVTYDAKKIVLDKINRLYNMINSGEV